MNSGSVTYKRWLFAVSACAALLPCSSWAGEASARTEVGNRVPGVPVRAPTVYGPIDAMSEQTVAGGDTHMPMQT